MFGGFQAGAFQLAYQQGTIAPTPSTPVIGGGGIGTRKRRAVVINGRPYIGTEDEIESLLIELLEDEAVEPVKVKAKPKSAPIQIEVEDESKEVPEQVNLPLYRSLVKESFRNEDPWLTYLLREIYRRFEEEEDDVEAILWGLH